MPASLLPLLADPRETLPVLQHLKENPIESPKAACTAPDLRPHTR